MLTERLELLLHPVRMRLVHTLRVGETLTTSQFCDRLPDLPKATVYRQLARLLRGGVFEVESERPVRGAIERRYRLVPGAAAVDADAARSMSLDDQRRGFTAAMAALMADFNAYLDRDGADPFADSVSYQQYTVWLSADERAQLIGEFTRLVRTLMERLPAEDRTPHLVSTIFFPMERPPQGDGTRG